MRLSHSKLCPVLLYPAVLPYRILDKYGSQSMTYIHTTVPNTAYTRTAHPAQRHHPYLSSAVSDHFTFPHADLERTVSHRPTSYLIQCPALVSPVPETVNSLWLHDPPPTMPMTMPIHSPREEPSSP
ncbi:hypothetical protein LX36DRAFT_193102 [Colletotrichum falcatum]|nr:hypothetical protein LX36DRAFT_193102 [Colletotrichum falcatum]